MSTTASDTIKQNAKAFPEVWYGLHFSEGLAEYKNEDSIDRIFISENTIKNMNPSLRGKPVYVQHVDEVDLARIQSEADGYVANSFWNPADGKCWCEFIVITDEGKEAIRRGWKLSNAYRPLRTAPGGSWHGMAYNEEIVEAEYEHLAIVPNPRYEESVILTPEQFQKYNDEKKLELKKLTNSKGEPTKMAFKFFKKAKIENALDIENTMVELPKSKREVSLSDAILTADTFHNMAGYADPEHMVKMKDGKDMSVKDMCNAFEKMMEEKNAKSEDGGEPGEDKVEEKNSDESLSEDMGIVGDRGGDESLKNKDEMEKELEEKKVKEDSKKKNELIVAQKAKALKNAGPHLLENDFDSQHLPRLLLSADKVQLGRQRYGSSAE